jgi:hypothetical protein
VDKLEVLTMASDRWEAWMEKLKAEGTYEAMKEAFENATLDDDKDELKKNMSLVRYAESIGLKVIPAGKAWRLDGCPICGDRKHFSINKNGRGEWYYNIFGDCAKGGDIFNFVIHIEKKASDFKEALEHIRNVRLEWEGTKTGE